VRLRNRSHERASIAALCFATLLPIAAADVTSQAGEPNYAARIGVFYDCLSIGSSALEPGTPVTIIRFNSQEDERFASGDTRERRIAARVVAKADLVDDCSSWIEDRSLRENSAELFLYALSSEIPEMLDSVEWGIGIVGISPGDEMPIDLDGNGIVDTFSKFVTFGGLVFEVWGGQMWFGEPIWTGSWHYDHGPDGPDEPEE
jgi:hypothetical protein